MECSALFNHISIVDGHGTVAPCCNIERVHQPWMRISDLNENQSLSDKLSLNLRKEIVESLRSGKFHDACRRCEYSEQDQGESLRRWFHTFLRGGDKENEFKLEGIELGLDYNCNMMCWICSPYNSTKWQSAPKLISQLDQKYDYPMFDKLDLNRRESVGDKIFNLLEEMDLSSLKKVRLVGGEPFLAKKFVDFVALLKRKTNINDIEISITTNASVLPNEKILETFSEFKKTEIWCSIDAVGEYASFIRPPTLFEKIENNFSRWLELDKKKSIELGIHTSISLLNIHTLPALLDWIDTFEVKTSFTSVQRPSVWSIKQLPEEVLQSIYKKREKIFDKYFLTYFFKNKEPFEPRFDELKRRIDIFSNHHGGSFKDLNPEMSDLLAKFCSDREVVL